MQQRTLAAVKDEPNDVTISLRGYARAPGLLGALYGRTEERPGGTHCTVTLHFGGTAVFDPARMAQSP